MVCFSPDVARKTLQLLLDGQHISTEQYRQIKNSDNEVTNSYVHHLYQLKFCLPETVLKTLSKHYQLPVAETIPKQLTVELLALSKRLQGYQQNIIPFAMRADKLSLSLLIVDPSQVIHQNDITRLLAMSVTFYLTSFHRFQTLGDTLKITATKKASDKIIALRRLSQLRAENKQRFQSQDKVISKDFADDHPVVLFVDALLRQAAKKSASDIHIEPYQTEAMVRFRIDGLLAIEHDYYAFINAHYLAVVARIKILANCDIAETRLPQDGSLLFLDENQVAIDVRLSIVPSKYGERLVMRLLRSKQGFNLDALQLSASDKHCLMKAIGTPQGMVLVTGPTGSGKSTTLYAALRAINQTHINIMTVEDPVEHHLDGVCQVQTNDAIGLSFANVLRAFLRQDPEVILVGEIRDQETVDVAIKAAFTGHLVLSTLHTNDAIGSIVRLMNMNIATFMIVSSVMLVVGQRLVRQNCRHCLSSDTANKTQAIQLLSLTEKQASQLKYGTGCPACRQTGFSGRRGVYEFLTMNEALADAIMANKGALALQKIARQNGFESMKDKAKTLLTQGVLSLAEYQRVFILE